MNEAATSLVGERDLLRRWMRQALTRAVAQQRTASRYRRYNLVLGILVTALAALGGTGVVATLAAKTDPVSTVVAGLLSVLAAILSAIHTYLRLGESYEAYRAGAAQFGGLQRRLEVAVTLYDEGSRYTKSELEAFSAELEQLDKGTRQVPDSIYNRVEKELARTATA